jgi:hypothetical protein
MSTPLSALSGTSNYNLGLPSFILSSTPLVIQSYAMQPEDFCGAYVITTFDCNVRDGFTFIAPNSSFLADFPSDDPTFNPLNTQLYYDILVDAGVNPLGPDYRANFAYQGTFLFTLPNSAARYYGSYFVVSSFSDQDLMRLMQLIGLLLFWMDLNQSVHHEVLDFQELLNEEFLCPYLIRRSYFI